VAGQQLPWRARFDDQPGDALRRMPRRLDGAQLDGAEPQRVAVAHGAMRKLRAGFRSDDDLRSGARGELPMPADEVGVQMRLDDVADRQPEPRRLVDVLIDVPLRIDDRAFPAVAGEVGGVGETGKVE